MAKKLVNIIKDFTLSHGGESHKIAAGVQRLEADLADHWYTKAHSDEVPKGVKQSDQEAQDEADEAELARMEAEEKAAAKADDASNPAKSGKKA